MDLYNENLPNHYSYTRPVVEFVTVAAEVCRLLEHVTDFDKQELTDTLVKVLPLLYQKTVMLTRPEEEFDGFLEQFATEDDYNDVSTMLQNVLGADDAYLAVFHADMQLSDTPMAAFISENLADVYQELKDMAGNYQTGDADVTGYAVSGCLEAFADHWGEKTLNALRALHHIHYNGVPEEENDTYEHEHGGDCDCGFHEHDEESRREDLFNYYRNDQ